MHATIIVLAFAGLSVAQSTTSLFIPGADAQPFIASIIGSVRVGESCLLCPADTSRILLQRLTPSNAFPVLMLVIVVFLEGSF
jgi:hypothetical protein